VFREYEKMRGGYQLKWMDDTRVLVIFDHPATGKGFAFSIFGVFLFIIPL
jgi:hypothetical protein